MSERYPIATLLQMAAIPEAARGRFLSELPDILRTVTQIEESVPALAQVARSRAPWPIRLAPLRLFEEATRRALHNGGVWVDDDKGTATVSMAWSKGDKAFFEQTEPMRNPRHER